jgi:pseudouridine kinase
VVVVGGANWDIFGFSAGPFLLRDSNPGHIEDSPGGVARNIAENLARLGVETHLITAFGSDDPSRRLAQSCRNANIDAGSSLTVEKVPGSRYLAALDEDGNLVGAVSDMRALEALTPEALADRSELLDTAALIVADTNLPADTLAWLVGASSVPVLLDPVSADKAKRSLRALPSVHTLKLNSLEAGSLLGRRIDPGSASDVESASADLMDMGVKRVFLTLGPLGVHARDLNDSLHLSPFPTSVVNATGAGDAFTAGVALAQLDEMTLAETAAFGSAMAAAALASERTVSESIDLAEIRKVTKEMLS